MILFNGDALIEDVFLESIMDVSKFIHKYIGDGATFPSAFHVGFVCLVVRNDFAEVVFEGVHGGDGGVGRALGDGEDEIWRLAGRDTTT